jgi:predicted unusual protein kinase regulating ubiquinone biosynthesis (AarF/ABC1/UbiB family)
VRRVRDPFLTDEGRARARDEQVLRLADDLVTTLGSMKGAAMKLGQVLSLLNLGLSSAAARDEFSRRLAPLFSQAPAADNAAMFRLIDAEVGARRSMIASIDPEPIAAASLGQVYRARLTDGRQVAIKAQYPSAKHAVRADLKNLALITRLQTRRRPGLGIDAVVAEVSDQITMELDYRRELASHREVWLAHRDHPVFVIPEPVEELCTERVLVTEYLEGAGLQQAALTDESDRNHVGEAIYRFYCGSLYTTGRFCADPHPGNIVVLADGRVGFLDFGLHVHMDDDEIGWERGILAALMTGDADTAYQLARTAGFIVDTDAMPVDMAIQYMEAVASWYLTPGSVRITDRVTHKSLSQAMLPGSDFRSGIFRQRMQSAHAFSRRTDMSVCALLGTLEAEGPWRDIASEWILGTAPATEMGVRIAAWRSVAG